MFKCEYCDRELKSKAGKVRHESSCKAKSVDFDELEENIAVIDAPTKEVTEPTNKVVQLEVLGMGGTYSNGSDNKYYEDHPRRLVKLQGLLSRTRDENERIKIIQMIVKLRNEHN